VPVPDLALIRSAQAGDTTAFDELMRRYVRSIYKVTYGFVRCHADADDLTQEAFIRAYRSIGRFNEQYQFYTWLRKIAVNVCINHLNRQKRFRFVSLTQRDGEAEAVDIADPNSDVDTAGLRRDLDRALCRLAPDQRTVFVLRVDQEMSYSEIAEQLSIPVGTVMSRLNRARARLRELLREYMPRA